MTSTSARSLTQSLDKLQISHGAKASPRRPPVESWEEEADADVVSPTSGPKGITRPLTVQDIAESPEPPPPTPSSPSIKSKATSTGSPYQTFPPYGLNGSWEAEDSNSGSSQRTTSRDGRPEKTTAAASRLIAAGIGQRPPRRTKEEREYDAAMKVQEKKKRDTAKEEEASKQREKEKALRSVWED